MSATVHITPGPTPTITAYRTCPCCKQPAHLVGSTQEWYTTTWTCCRCGDSWAGGELLPRPFQRGWRNKAIKRAHRLWWQALRPLDRE